MSHEIQSSDTVVPGSNQPAWHGLGKVFPGLLSPLRAYAEGVGARKIESCPVFAGAHSFPGFRGLVAVNADGSRHALSVVSSTYGLLQDSDFFQILESVYKGRAVVETAGTLRGGRRVWALAQHDAFKVGAGDEVRTYDLWLNAHDGSSCFELHRTNVRVVCANTWRQAVGRGSARVLGVTHRTNVRQHALDAAGQVARANESEVVSRIQLANLTLRPLGVDKAVEVFSRVLGVPEGGGKAAPRVQSNLDTLVSLFRRGAGNEGKTAWDGFNAVTEFVDHNRPVRVARGRDRAETRFENAVLGGNDLKARAYDLLLNLNA